LSTLANAVSVLRLFSADRVDISVTDVSRLLAMPKSSASRLLKAMREAGLVAHVGSTPRYRVGHLLFEVARLHRVNSTLIGLTDQYLAAICRETGHTGYVSILNGRDVLVIRLHPGSHALRVVTPLGSRAPAFATATGRTLLARFGAEEIRTLYPEPLAPPSPNTPQELSELLSALEEVRQRGWCEAVDEAIPGVGSIAVSVADAENAETLSFCLSYSAPLVPEAEKRRMIGMLTAAARDIGAKLDDAFWLSPRLATATAAQSVGEVGA
jgi:IclR family KDG regulon transcriptional repressor